MGSNWMVVMLVMAAFGPSYPSAGAQTAQTNPTVLEIEAGCHRLILAHECRSFRDALVRTPPEGRERILTEYLATIQERQSDCRCDLAAGRSPHPPPR